MIRRTIAIAFALGFILPSLAVAGEVDAHRASVELSDEQMALNAAGVEALIEEQPARAVALLTDAYRIEPANILALNLGRAYHFLGQCDRARQKLDEVSELPAVEDPPASRIDERAREYLADVDEYCEDDQEAEVDAPDAEEQPQVDDDVDLDEITATDDDDATEDLPPRHSTAGLAVITTGAAMMASGAGLHLFARYHRSQVTDFDGEINTEITQAEARDLESRANLYDTVALITAVGGAATAGLGTYLLLRSTSYDATAVDLQLSDGFRGITVQRRF